MNDLTDEQFLRGVDGLCRYHPEIYPGSNVCALIRKYGLDESSTLTPVSEAWKEAQEFVAGKRSEVHPFTARIIRIIGKEKFEDEFYKMQVKNNFWSLYRDLQKPEEKNFKPQ